MITTKLERPVGRKRAAEAIGISRQGLHSWTSRLITEPIKRAGLEPPESLSLHEVWAIAIARVVRQQGESQATATDVFDFLSSLPRHAVSQAFKENRRCLFIIDGSLLPRLVSIESTVSAEFKQLEVEAERIGYVPRMLRLNVQPLLQQLAELVRD